VTILFLLATIFLSGCAHNPQVEAFEASIGTATQAELISRFGYPQRLQHLRNGGEVWGYEFLAGDSRCIGYRVYFDQELRSQRWEATPCRESSR